MHAALIWYWSSSEPVGFLQAGPGGLSEICGGCQSWRGPAAGGLQWLEV